EAMARIGRLDEADRLLSGATFDPATHGFLSWWRSRAIASIEMTRDESPHAVAALESVVAEAERQGLVLEALWARLDLGALLSSSDPERAGQILREAGAEAELMKATTEMRLADQGLRSLGVRTWRRGRSTRGEGAVGELSEREREIASRLASGASNPEIAAALFLSRKTVERHVS